MKSTRIVSPRTLSSSVSFFFGNEHERRNPRRGHRVLRGFLLDNGAGGPLLQQSNGLEIVDAVLLSINARRLPRIERRLIGRALEVLTEELGLRKKDEPIYSIFHCFSPINEHRRILILQELQQGEWDRFFNRSAAEELKAEAKRLLAEP